MEISQEVVIMADGTNDRVIYFEPEEVKLQKTTFPGNRLIIAVSESAYKSMVENIMRIEGLMRR